MIIRYLLRSALICIALFCLAVTPPANARSVGKSIGKGAAKSITKRIARKAATTRQILGKLYNFKKPQTLIRWTKSPSLDKARGLPTKSRNAPHVFTQYPHVGRKASARHAEKNLNINHKVRCWQKLQVPAGTQYHVRPIKGGAKGEKEIILHRVPRNWIRGGSCYRK